MRDSGMQFDPEIVEPFVRMAEEDLPQIAQIREPDPEPAYRRENAT
jgi:response regulator RpfG family c-di-GMP phosphodiesterase